LFDDPQRLDAMPVGQFMARLVLHSPSSSGPGPGPGTASHSVNPP
jgi:hypothetical protein